ncbi:unnamed protein product [Calicophoron daubneyi]|uniref:Uncharacterized protein n=1 Tax=Calicophoron daubneyi TaxID=300641 RepID=A0AAV2SVX3_CALDB
MCSYPKDNLTENSKVRGGRAPTDSIHDPSTLLSRTRRKERPFSANFAPTCSRSSRTGLQTSRDPSSLGRFHLLSRTCQAKQVDGKSISLHRFNYHLNGDNSALIKPPMLVTPSVDMDDVDDARDATKKFTVEQDHPAFSRLRKRNPLLVPITLHCLLLVTVVHIGSYPESPYARITI